MLMFRIFFFLSCGLQLLSYTLYCNTLFNEINGALWDSLSIARSKVTQIYSSHVTSSAICLENFVLVP